MIPFSFRDRQLFAGSATSKFKGGPPLSQFLSLVYGRNCGPFPGGKQPILSYRFRCGLYEFRNFPYWMENNILEKAKKRPFEINRQKNGAPKSAPEINSSASGLFSGKQARVYLTYHPDFSRAIKLGLRALLTRLGEGVANHQPGEKGNFRCPWRGYGRNNRVLPKPGRRSRKASGEESRSG